MPTAASIPRTAASTADKKQPPVPTLAQTRILHWMAQPNQSVAARVKTLRFPELTRGGLECNKYTHPSLTLPLLTTATLKALLQVQWAISLDTHEARERFALSDVGRDALTHGQHAHAVALHAEFVRADYQSRVQRCGERVGEARTQLKTCETTFIALGIEAGQPTRWTDELARALREQASALYSAARRVKEVEAELTALRMVIPG